MVDAVCGCGKQRVRFKSSLPPGTTVINNGYGHGLVSITIQRLPSGPESVGRQWPCHKGRREYILVGSSPASLPNARLCKAIACHPGRKDDHGHQEHL